MWRLKIKHSEGGLEGRISPLRALKDFSRTMTKLIVSKIVSVRPLSASENTNNKIWWSYFFFFFLEHWPRKGTNLSFLTQEPVIFSKALLGRF
jgi:hypothetical protein